jgi:hypothetical protein
MNHNEKVNLVLKTMLNTPLPKIKRLKIWQPGMTEKVFEREEKVHQKRLKGRFIT